MKFFMPWISGGIALSVSLLMIPLWIEVCKRRSLFEDIDTRKKHRRFTPGMGGLAIFAGIMLSYTISSAWYRESSLLPAALLLIFFTGFFDDLINLPPLKKLIPQLAAAVLVVISGIRLDHLPGLFGLEGIPAFVAIPLTIFFIIAVTNAFNLIDGLDGLAGSMAFIASANYAVLFLRFGDEPMAMLSIAIAGATLGFLRYNFNPARIFMGDTGALLLGFLLAVQSLSLFQHFANAQDLALRLSPSFVVAVLFIPLYDVIRVSSIRILTGYSPFQADRNHIHHMIARQGFGPRITLGIILSIKLYFICLALLCPDISLHSFILISLLSGIVLINTLTISWLAMLYGRIGTRVHYQTLRVIRMLSLS